MPEKSVTRGRHFAPDKVIVACGDMWNEKKKVLFKLLPGKTEMELRRSFENLWVVYLRWRTLHCYLVLYRGDKIRGALGWVVNWIFLGASSQNCEKRLLASACLSVRPHGTVRLPLDGFSWNFVLEYFFRRTVEKIEGALKCNNNNGYFISRPIYVFNHILLNSSWNDKCFLHICRENWNSFYVITFFFENRSLYEIVWEILLSRADHRWQYGECTLHAG